MVVLVCALATAGCGQKVKDEMITAEQTPSAVTAAAESVFPGLVCDQVWKFEQDGETVYELRGKTPDGKAHEATVSASGKVLWPVAKK